MPTKTNVTVAVKVIMLFSVGKHCCLPRASVELRITASILRDWDTTSSSMSRQTKTQNVFFSSFVTATRPVTVNLGSTSFVWTARKEIRGKKTSCQHMNVKRWRIRRLEGSYAINLSH